MRTNDWSYCQASAKRVENTLVLLDTCLRGRFPAINANYNITAGFHFNFRTLGKKADKQHVVNLARKKSSIRENGSLLEMRARGGGAVRGNRVRVESILITRDACKCSRYLMLRLR